MNQINTYDRKIAETLKSLSLAPAPVLPMPTRRYVRLYMAGIGVFLLLGMSGLGVVVWPMITQSTTPPDITLNTPVEAIAHQAGDPTTVVTASVPLIQEIAGSGYVVAPQSTVLFAKYGGILTDISVDVGARVKAGQVVAVLDDRTARFALEQAQAARASAALALAADEITLAQARALLERMNALATRNVASGLQLDEADSVLLIAENAVAQGRQNVRSAELAIRMSREPVDALFVRAPISGSVTQLNASVGDTVLGHENIRDDSQSLLTITNTDALVIDADVAEANIAFLQTGLKGEAVLDGFPDAPFAIELAQIAPVVSAAKGTITIRLTLNAPPVGIRPNMAARIRIIAPLSETN